MLVTFRVAAENVPEPLYGTGFLVPRHIRAQGREPWAVTACTFLDRKWPHLAREGEVLLRASLGRIDDARPDRMDRRRSGTAGLGRSGRAARGERRTG